MYAACDHPFHGHAAGMKYGVRLFSLFTLAVGIVLAAPADKPAAKTPKAGNPPTEPPAKIEGITIPRANGGFLGLQVVNGVFDLTFYDAKKKVISPDVDRAALRWDAKYKVGQERTVLNPADDGKSLTSPKVVRPPLTFKLFITLVKAAAAEENPVNESYAINFRQ